MFGGLVASLVGVWLSSVIAGWLNWSSNIELVELFIIIVRVLAPVTYFGLTAINLAEGRIHLRNIKQLLRFQLDQGYILVLILWAVTEVVSFIFGLAPLFAADRLEKALVIFLLLAK